MKLLFTALLAFVALSNARIYHYRNDPNVVPLGWKLNNAAPTELKNHKISFTLALYQENLQELDHRFWLVSDPRSEYYGAYMTNDEVRDLVSPSEETRNAVYEWVAEHGGYVGRDNGDSLEVFASLHQVEQMFNTKMGVYKHVKFDTKYVSFMSHVSIENEEIANKIHIIVGLELPFIKKQVKKRISQGTETTFTCVTPDTLYNMYNVDGRNSSFYNSGNSRCTAEFQEVQGNLAFSKTDLTGFQQGMNQNPATDVSNIIGKYDPDTGVGEANLDVQYITSFVSETETVYWTGKLWIYEWTQEVLNSTTQPLVHSISYGAPENVQSASPDGKGWTNQQYVNRTNIEFQKFGVLGMTVVVASGDQGANGLFAYEDKCKNESNWLQPDFPGSSPYVVSVGATAMLIGSTTTEQFDDVPACKSDINCISDGIEIGCQQYANLSALSTDNPLITSGGGFSLFASNETAPYQRDVVQQYLEIESSELPPDQYWNRYGRAYPDLSALGHAYAVYGSIPLRKRGDESYEPIDGTSASAPVVAGMISMLNGNQLNQGKQPLGFFNPLLYQMAAANPATIRDITVGDNKCTEMSSVLGIIPEVGACCTYGYNAVEGFDPFTGLGSLIFDEALNYIDANTQAPKKQF